MKFNYIKRWIYVSDKLFGSKRNRNEYINYLETINSDKTSYFALTG